MRTYLEDLLIDPDSPDIDASLHRVHQLYVGAIQQYLGSGEPEQAAALQTEALTWFPNSDAIKGLLPASGPAGSPSGD